VSVSRMWRQLSSHVVRRAAGRLPCTIPRGVAGGVGTGIEPASIMGHVPCGARFFANNNDNNNKNAPKHKHNNHNKPQKTGPARSGGQPPKGNHKGNKGNKPALTFRLVMSEDEEDEEYDLDDDKDRDDFTIIKVPSAPKTLADLHPHFLKSELLDEEDLAEGVEIQTNSGEWEVLHDVAQLAGIRKRPIPLRNPAMFGMFGESDEDEDYDGGETDYSSDSDDDDGDVVWALRIGGLVVRLQTQGYVPTASPDSWALVPKSPGDQGHAPPIPTRDWILQEAAHDPGLQRTLLNKVGALDHIVQCLHMPFVWETQTADNGKEEGATVEAAFTHEDE
jgi:hypothetical protein